ncbi:MAG: S-layer homology domain-containing protein [Holophagae bacterium]
MPVFGTHSEPSAPAWGTGNWTILNLPAVGFDGLRDGLYWTTAAGSIYHYEGWQYYDCPFQLPTGAILYGVTPTLYDNSSSQSFSMWIWKHNHPGDSGYTTTTLYDWDSGGSATPGWVGNYRSLASPETIINWDVPGDAAQFYAVRVKLSSTPDDTDILFAGLTLWYQLQVSPAPGTATFGDVPTGHPFFRFVEALADSGITAGCGGGNYCPDAPVTRGQMAVFLSSALGLHWPDAG